MLSMYSFRFEKHTHYENNCLGTFTEGCLCIVMLCCMYELSFYYIPYMKIFVDKVNRKDIKRTAFFLAFLIIYTKPK